MKSFTAVPVAQTSSSFKCLNTCMTPMHTTPTFITEVLCLVTYGKYNCFNDCYSRSSGIYSNSLLGFYNMFNYKATPATSILTIRS